MDVSSNRTVNDVIILGSSKSISYLSQEEVNYINKSKTVIALNKFMIYYKLSGILPTHVFFLDYHDTSLKILDYIFKICISDQLDNLTFIVPSQIEGLTYRTKQEWIAWWFNKNWENLIKIINRQKVKNKLNDFLGKFVLYRIPKKSEFIYTSHNDWRVGGEWATDLSMPLYHYRGSLTSVLNYAAIIKPNSTFYLIGTDFNSSEYFFQKELEKLPFNWKDWTAPIVVEHNKHFSAIEYQGKTIFDHLPFIVSKLQNNGNNVYCTNPNSLLVTVGNIAYKELPVSANIS